MKICFGRLFQKLLIKNILLIQSHILHSFKNVFLSYNHNLINSPTFTTEKNPSAKNSFLSMSAIALHFGSDP